MASGQHAYTFTLTVAGNAYAYSHTVSDTAPDEYTAVSFGESVAASQTNEEHGLAIDVSKAVSVFIAADYDVTIKTNSSGAPDNTLAIKANHPYIWVTGKSLDTNQLTVDVTKIYVTTGATATFVRIQVLLDNSAP